MGQTPANCANHRADQPEPQIDAPARRADTPEIFLRAADRPADFDDFARSPHSNPSGSNRGAKR